jgi:kynurenine formamidase
MARRFIDISVTLRSDIKSDPDFMVPQIDYSTHANTNGDICDFFPGLTKDDLPGGQGWAVESIRLSTHNGTHVDAPWHYHPTMDGGARAIAIDKVPLEWFFQPAVKLDFRHQPDGHVVQPDQLDAAFKKIGHTLRPLDIVLMNTAAGARYGHPDYLMKGCGFGRDATLWLTERGVRVVGTDAWSWDAPFGHTKTKWEKTRDPSIIWEGHKAGMVRGYCQIEKLGNLEALPDKGFQVACFPAKIKDASAGWTRAVAIIDE